MAWKLNDEGARFRRGRRASLVLSAVLCSATLVACGSAGNENEVAAPNECDVTDSFPSGPIQLTVPFAAGGGTDTVARMVAQELSARLDTQVHVVNRAGGGGVTGHQFIANAPADGKTLLFTGSDLVMNHWQGLTDITPQDLTPISKINADPAGFTVSADAPWDTLEDVLEYASDNPRELSASGAGNGSIWHLAMAGLLLAEDIPTDSINWVPSEGAAPALQQVVAGGVHIATSSIAESQTLIDSGKAKALAVMSDERDPNFPDVPTVNEAVGADYSSTVWRGLLAPPGLDPEIVQEIDCEVANIVESEEFIEFMDNTGLRIDYENAEEFEAFLQENNETMGRILKATGLID